MTDRVDSDVAVVREALDYLRTVQARKVAWRDEAYAALDRLQARLEVRVCGGDHGVRYLQDERPCPYCVADEAEAERDEARADAERLAEAGHRLRHSIGPNPRAEWDAALAAHTPHLTVPERPPTGTTYVTEEP